MQFLCAGCFLLVALFPVCAADAPLKEARERWLRGNYAEARTLFEQSAKDPKDKIPALLGLCRVLRSQGLYDEALKLLDAASAADPKQADLLAARADLLHFRGRWKEAEQAAEMALKLKADHLLARWVRSNVYWDQGDLDKADADLRWIVRYYSDRSNKDQDIKDPDELLIVGLAATENARWHRLSDQFQTILNDVYGEALKTEKSFWLAECQAGLLLLEKYNRAEAQASFTKALTINPSAPEALLGKAWAALQGFELREAEVLSERILKINPNMPEAHRLRADLHFGTNNLKEAKQALDRALAINPRDEQTLGRLATYYLLNKEPAKFDALAGEVVKHNPKPGVFYLELASRLEDRKQFAAAEKYYLKAMELRPMIPASRNGLGMLYMRMGREKEAHDVLTKAFQADEFNVRVSNSLKVLRHLGKYTTLKTAHFELRYDPQVDKLLAAYMAHALEELYAELAKEFQYSPPQPILLEVFNNHEMFSGRTIALPDLHTIGASTGRIIAMVSPQGKGMRKPFNWGRVIRHELVHVFNLEQTNFQCPHWFTEGLAVLHEGFPRPPQWNQLLKERVRDENLFDLDSIDLGFIRPRSPLDWSLAYCQSSLYVTYIRETYGPKSIGEMLAAFAEGMDTAGALTKVCLVDKPAFEKGFKNYLKEVVQNLPGKPAEKKMSLAQLQKAVEANPKDLDQSARLAEQYLIRRDRKEARKLVEEVLKAKSGHPLASYVKARLLLDAGDEDQAKELLESALDRKQPESRIIRALGRIYYEVRAYDKAADLFELAQKAEPDETAWLDELVRVYTQKGDRPKLMDTLKKLVPLDPDEFDKRKRLTLMLNEAKRYVEAEKFAREALEIDVRDTEVQEALHKALLGQDKKAEAERIKQLLQGK